MRMRSCSRILRKFLLLNRMANYIPYYANALKHVKGECLCEDISKFDDASRVYEPIWGHPYRRHWYHAGTFRITLRWHHNEHDGVSNHRRLDCLLNCLLRRRENIKAPRHWPLCGEFTGDRWIPRTKGQWHGNSFNLMTSSCVGYLCFPSRPLWRHSNDANAFRITCPL